MLKILLKKQFTELFRGFFYDQKKKTSRSKRSTVLWIIMFVFLMVVVLGGTFASVAVGLAIGFVRDNPDLSWLYFAVLGLISLVLGVFASVFNTYQGLYLSKDNDLLLSMPIPVRTIITSRLLGVYLLGLMYSSLVFLPAIVVYFVLLPFSLAVLFGGIVMLAVISVIVLVLSCLLGWVVAKISLRLKNKSFIVVLVSLAFIGGYYFIYFKAQAVIRDLVANAVQYGEKIKGSAYIMYLFGRVGAGDILAVAVFAAAAAALFVLTWYVLSRSFLKIATSSGAVAKTAYREKAVKGASASAALLRREFGRFLSSPNYMLNCGMGVILIPVAGVALLIKGKFVAGLLQNTFGEIGGVVSVLFCAVLCMLASMNDMAAPSVSLEGKSLWLVKSLPVTPWQALRAKLLPQILLTLVPMALCFVGAAFVLPDGLLITLLACLTAAVYVVFNALFGLFLGVKRPNLDWTNEIVPIKQSMSVTIALFSGWGYALLLGGGYLLIGRFIGAAVYLSVFLLLSALGCVLLWRWMKTKGVTEFAAL